MVKANVDVAKDVFHVRFGSAKSQNGKAVVAGQEGARLIFGESAHKLEIELFEVASQLRFLAILKMRVGQLGTTRHIPGSTVRIGGTTQRKIEERRESCCHEDLLPSGRVS